MHSGFDIHQKRVAIDDSKENTAYYCPLCHHRLIRKMGEIKRHHFAHAKGSSCDSWFMEDGVYSDKWKSLFLVDKIETVLQKGEDKHFADIQLGDTVLEVKETFSFPKASMEERNQFFLSSIKKVIWIFDGYTSPIQYFYKVGGEEREDYLIFETDLLHERIENLSFTFLHAKRTLENVLSLLSPQVEIYFQINDHLLLKVKEFLGMEKGNACFKGDLLKITSFLTEEGIQAKEEPFLNFYQERKQEYNHNVLLSHLHEEAEKEETKNLDKMQKGDALLKENTEGSLKEFCKLYGLSQLPSETLPYFYTKGKPFYLDDYLIQINLKEREKREALERNLEKARAARQKKFAEEKEKQEQEKKEPPKPIAEEKNYTFEMLKKPAQVRLDWQESKVEIDFTKDNLSPSTTINTEDIFKHCLTFRYQQRRVTLKEASRFVKNEALLVEMKTEEQEYQEKIVSQKQKFLLRDWKKNLDEDKIPYYTLELFGHELLIYCDKDERIFYPCYPDSQTYLVGFDGNFLCTSSLVSAAKILFDVTFNEDNADEHVSILSPCQIRKA